MLEHRFLSKLSNAYNQRLELKLYFLGPLIQNNEEAACRCDEPPLRFFMSQGEINPLRYGFQSVGRPHKIWSR